VIDRRLVRDIQVPLERLVDDARARAAAAVVEIDDGAVERERLLDVAPVVLVRGDRVWTVVLDRCASVENPRMAVVAKARAAVPATPDAFRN
jgi:hypothetical protein